MVFPQTTCLWRSVLNYASVVLFTPSLHFFCLSQISSYNFFTTWKSSSSLLKIFSSADNNNLLVSFSQVNVKHEQGWTTDKSIHPSIANAIHIDLELLKKKNYHHPFSYSSKESVLFWRIHTECGWLLNLNTNWWISSDTGAHRKRTSVILCCPFSESQQNKSWTLQHSLFEHYNIFCPLRLRLRTRTFSDTQSSWYSLELFTQNQQKLFNEFQSQRELRVFVLFF